VNTNTLNQIFRVLDNFQSMEISLSRTPSFVLNDTCLRRKGLQRLKASSSIIAPSMGTASDASEYTNLDAMISRSCFSKSLHWRHCTLLNSCPTKVRLQHLPLLYVEDDVPELTQFLSCPLVPRSCKFRGSTPALNSASPFRGSRTNYDVRNLGDDEKCIRFNI
jgi:hypothetical protein